MKDLDRQQLDQIAVDLLAPFEQARGPGMTIGVLQDDELIVHRSSGFANFELSVPIGPETIFRIASVSKQFTCAAILRLAADGKLHLEGDIRDWLPPLPDLGQRITLDHLMRNTSGIRDMLEVMRLGGIDLDHPCTEDDLLDGICRQRTLNFPPGTRYIYSNSGFMLLGRVAEMASGESLDRLFKRYIFTPLGMSSTRHMTSAREPVPGLATGYISSSNGSWRPATHNFALGGEGGLVSSVKDLARWLAWLNSPAGAWLAGELAAAVPFPDGPLSSYGRGVGLRRYRGVSLVEHGGLWPGFRTACIRIPGESLGLIAITNYIDADPHAALAQLLDAICDGMADVFPVSRMPPHDQASGLDGRWIDRDATATMDIEVDESGKLTANLYGSPIVLRPLNDGRLGISGGSTPFALRQLSDRMVEVEQDAGIRFVYEPAPEVAVLPAGLSGRYACDDAAATWTFDGRTLAVDGPLHCGTIWTVEPIDGDLFRIRVPTYRQDVWWDARVVRGAAGDIEALAVNGARIRNVLFQRLPSETSEA
jgi:D-aminopeptidase